MRQGGGEPYSNNIILGKGCIVVGPTGYDKIPIERGTKNEKRKETNFVPVPGDDFAVYAVWINNHKPREEAKLLQPYALMSIAFAKGKGIWYSQCGYGLRCNFKKVPSKRRNLLYPLHLQ